MSRALSMSLTVISTPGDGVSLLVKALGFVEVDVYELRIVLIEAGFEHGDNAECFAMGGRRAGRTNIRCAAK